MGLTIAVHIRIAMIKTHSLLHLLQLSSATLPVGAYAYSQGLEYAIDHYGLKDKDAVEHWIHALMKRSLGSLDLPVLRRMYTAWSNKDYETINFWNDFLLANRETHELLLEDEQLGLALGRLLKSLAVTTETQAFDLLSPSFVSQFSLAGAYWKIGIEELCQGFVWSWLENQVAAATKLVPLGQTQAQQLLLKLIASIPPIVAHSTQLNDDELGVSLPGLTMVSALHERQYSRLFRS